MNIIRDNELGGLAMIPLLFDWGVRRCNVKGCTERPNTIVTGMVEGAAVGFCETHYQQGNKPDGTNFTLPRCPDKPTPPPGLACHKAPLRTHARPHARILRHAINRQA